MKKKKRQQTQIGKLPPRHKFFLNSYADERFTRCPGCGEPNKARKMPFLIYIEPAAFLVLNMTGRYCPLCDLVILHKDVVEDLMVRSFERHDPSVIGHNYVIVGTVERAYWRESKEKATPGDVFDSLHDFECEVHYEPMRPRWLPDESQ